MRGLLALLLLAWLGPAPVTAAERPGLLAIYWQPPGTIAPAPAVRSAFARAMEAQHALLIDAIATAPAPPSLAPDLAGAIAEYNAFHFAEAAARLSELSRLVDAKAGADLDHRQLAELYLYRGMARLELGQADFAWDDFVRAARLDPARVLDPTHFPPRVTATFRRAIGEAAQLPRVELQVVAPTDAQIRVDGRPLLAAASLSSGAHFVAVEAAGFESWSGVVTLSAAHEHFAPPLRPIEPPSGDRLLELAGGRPAQRIVLGALMRSNAGWRLLVRSVELPALRTISAEVPLDASPVERVVAEALRRLDAARPLEQPRGAPSVSSRPKSRWWIWAIAGGVAAALAIAIPVGIVSSESSPSGTVGGPLGPLR